VLYFLYEWLGNAAVANEYRRYLINAWVIVPVTFLAAVITIHFLFKSFYLKEKKVLFWVLASGTMIMVTLARRTFNYYYTYPLYYPEALDTTPFLFLPKLVIEAVNIYLIVALYSMFYFFRAYFEQQKLTQALQQDKIQSELALLKLQVHPHFIFNTLNNIYSFSLQNSKKTPDLIYRLSSFLDYNLYDSKSEYVPLTKEMEYISNYIELEKVRFGDRLDVSLNIFDDISKSYISPMLTLPLVENAFKHGAGKTNTVSWIRIDVSAGREWILINIENSCHSRGDNGAGKGSGIGLENVRRRLEILYPGAFTLQVFQESQSYLVKLKLKNKFHED
jgi:sensor histidine kinase YesM